MAFPLEIFEVLEFQSSKGYKSNQNLLLPTIALRIPYAIKRRCGEAFPSPLANRRFGSKSEYFGTPKFTYVIGYLHDSLVH